MKVTVNSFTANVGVRLVKYPKVEIDLPQEALEKVSKALWDYKEMGQGISLCSYLQDTVPEYDTDFFQVALSNGGGLVYASSLNPQADSDLLRQTWAKATARAIDKALEQSPLLRDFQPGKPCVLREKPGAKLTYLGKLEGQDLHSVRDSFGELALVTTAELVQAPICWVEGRPVYPGDTLFCKSNGEEYVIKEGDIPPALTWKKKEKVFLEGTPLQKEDRVYFRKLSGDWAVGTVKSTYVDPLGIQVVFEEGSHSVALSRLSRQPLFVIDDKFLEKGDEVYLRDKKHPAYGHKYVFSEVDDYRALFSKGENVHISEVEKLFTREKPFVLINEFKVPLPESEPLSTGQQYWTLSLEADTSWVSYWNPTKAHYCRLRAGIVHLSQEAAQLHLDALKSFMKVE